MALRSGGWVSETSRSFRYWQSAPRLLQWLSSPGNPAIRSHPTWKGETATHHTELTVEREQEGENTWRRAPMPNNVHCKHYRCEGCQHVSGQEHMESWCMHMSKALLTIAGMQAFIVVNLTLVVNLTREERKSPKSCPSVIRGSTWRQGPRTWLKYDEEKG